MSTQLGHFIDGRLRAGASGRAGPVFDPATGRSSASVSFASQEETRAAIQAARAALPAWAETPPLQRARVLFRFKTLLDAHIDDLAALITSQHGKVLADARGEVTRGIEVIEFACGIPHLLKGEFSDNVGGGVDCWSLRQPLGVCAGITPFNFPAMVPLWMFPVAIACGNTFVLKPSEKDPSCGLRLAELLMEAGLPPGVFNVVPGYGHEAGEALALHMDVDAIGFTGSTRVGRKMLEYAGRSNLKRVYNELGGKSAFVVFPDFADVERAAKTVAGSMFFNQGESCNAPSRVFVHESIAERFLAVVAAEAPKYRPDDPLSGSAAMGAIVDETQMRTVLGYIDAGQTEGAKVVTGGKRTRTESGGYFVEPTVFDGVTNTMKIAREEIFGPVMSVIRFKTEAEAIAMANDSSYGLQASVWSDNVNRAHRVARALRAGTVHVNQYDEDDITVPFGGYKQSGNGRDKSLHAFDKYTELKTTWLRVDSDSE